MTALSFLWLIELFKHLRTAVQPESGSPMLHCCVLASPCVLSSPKRGSLRRCAAHPKFVSSAASTRRIDVHSIAWFSSALTSVATRRRARLHRRMHRCTGTAAQHELGGSSAVCTSAAIASRPPQALKPPGHSWRVVLLVCPATHSAS
jgi:hypothetical protein